MDYRPDLSTTEIDIGIVKLFTKCIYHHNFICIPFKKCHIRFPIIFTASSKNYAVHFSSGLPLTEVKMARFWQRLTSKKIQLIKVVR